MYFRLFSNCIIVKGANRSVICDLQKGRVIFIPNDLYRILNSEKVLSISKLNEKYDDQNIPQLVEYLTFLEKQEVLQKAENIAVFEHFSQYDLSWEWPSIITNLLIDINISSKINLLTKQIEECSENLFCQNLQLRIFSLPLSEGNYSLMLKKILANTQKSMYRNIEILLPYTSEEALDELMSLMNDNLRILSVTAHSVPKNILENSKERKLIILTQEVISKATSCGIVSIKYFSSDYRHFTEAQKHNTCLNRKISIDVNGEIKNCPSMAKSYGNIKDTTLAEAIEKPGFKDMWFINKDQIAVCKDCEFRYICTDCRAYIENPEDIYSKPLKCGYNPYTAEWEEWSTNPLKQKAIEYYGMQELVKKDK